LNPKKFVMQLIRPSPTKIKKAPSIRGFTVFLVLDI
jgi:hypothetical protein